MLELFKQELFELELLNRDFEKLIIIFSNFNLVIIKIK